MADVIFHECCGYPRRFQTPQSRGRASTVTDAVVIVVVASRPGAEAQRETSNALVIYGVVVCGCSKAEAVTGRVLRRR
jgi:hypothetical protein